MAGSEPERAGVALVSGRISSRESAERVADLATRLTLEGLVDGLFCVGGAGLLAAEGCRAVESPWLGCRGLRRLAARQLARGVGLETPSLLHALDPEAWEASAALAGAWGVGFVQSIEDYGWWPSGVGRSLHPHCRGLLVASGALADRLVDQWGIDRECLILCTTGIEPPDRPSELRSGNKSTARVIGVVARWDETSGLSSFLGAARLLLARGLDLEFVVAGEGPLGPDLRLRAERFGIAERVTFAEPPTLDDAFWRVLDVYCQPSLAPTLGRWAATAMAGGIPVVATQVEGLDRLIQDGRTARPVRVDAQAELADAIADLLEHPLEARAMGERGRRLVDDILDPDRAVEDLRSAYSRFATAV